MFGNSSLMSLCLWLCFRLIGVVFVADSASTSDNYLLNKNTTSISISARTKFNGSSSKSTIIPVNSRVNIHCRVWLNKTQLHFFNLMMVTFTLPTGEHVVPKKCIVNAEQTSKRCKIVIQRFTSSYEGRYRCESQYFSGEDVIKKHKDIFLYVEKHGCPSSKLFCHENNGCVDSLRECKNNILPSEKINTTLSNTEYAKKSFTPVLSTGHILSITGMVVVLILTTVVVLCIKRKRQALHNRKHTSNQTTILLA